ncbi:uncharacterized protein LOC110866503 [Helianthus annuus]|uniref:uncharacterized protein LOC110866503 n=1 Tax=Helianthus annuus TaxID=4232 RepID=UPI000B9002E1|nr:uncharacterized protein LOC110866503 [Helianthus annuus]
MRNFLWSSEGSFHKGKAKASWKSVCVPKFEGGLGIRRIGDVNKALMISHIWSILIKRESLWVAWIHLYRLRGKSFWVCKSISNCCWSWRKLLQLRSTIRDFVWAKLGDGSTTSAWYDYWCQIGPLGNLISPRSIATAGFDITSTVQAVQLNVVWRWPVAWRDLALIMCRRSPINVTSCCGRMAMFFRSILLLEFGNRFGIGTKKSIGYSLQVWNLVRSKGGMDSVGPFWDDIVEWMAARVHSKSAANYVSKLVLAAASYFIWQERELKTLQKPNKASGCTE